MCIFRSCIGGAAVEGSEVEETAHEGPTHWHVGYENCRAGFPNIPECPHGGEGMCEGVVFVEDGAENLDCESFLEKKV